MPDLHQSDSRKNWRDVRQSGDHYRREGAEIFSSVRIESGASLPLKMGRGHRFAHAREGSEEQSAAPFREAEFDILYGKESRGKASARFSLK